MTSEAGGVTAAELPGRGVGGTAPLNLLRRWLLFGVVAFAAFYWTPVTIGGLSLRPFEAMLLAWAALFLASTRISINAAVVGLFALGLSLSASLVAWGFDMSGLLLGARLAVALLLVAMITSEATTDRATLDRAVTVWLASGATIVVVGVAAWVLALVGGVRLGPLLYNEGLGFRAQSVVLDPNRFGNFSGSLFAAAAVAVLVRRSGRRWWGLLAVVALLGLLTSQSRAALAAAVAAAGLATLWGLLMGETWRGGRIFLRVTVAAGALAMVVVYLLATSPSLALLARWSAAALNAQDTLVGNIRFQFAVIILQRVFESVPTALFGIGEFSHVRGDLGVAFSPHNTYLAVLAAQGLLGLLAYLGLLGALLVRGLAAVHARAFQADEGLTALRLSLMAAFLTVVIQGLSTVLVTTGFAWVTVAVYTASLVVERRPGADAAAVAGQSAE